MRICENNKYSAAQHTTFRKSSSTYDVQQPGKEIQSCV